ASGLFLFSHYKFKSPNVYLIRHTLNSMTLYMFYINFYIDRAGVKLILTPCLHLLMESKVYSQHLNVFKLFDFVPFNNEFSAGVTPPNHVVGYMRNRCISIYEFRTALITLITVATEVSTFIYLVAQVDSEDLPSTEWYTEYQSGKGHLSKPHTHIKILVKSHRVRECSDLDRKHDRSGVYKINPSGGAGFKAYCDMETDGGGWTVFQHRQDGKVDFYRGWEEYVNGFGNLKTEFWLGNDKLHKLTSKGQYELRVNLEDFNGDTAYAKYSNFYIGDKSTNYKLTVNGYSGTAGDSLKGHNNHAFSTKDKDNDSHGSIHCATYYKGAWWYEDCHASNLNGLYVGNKKDNKGMRWSQWKGSQSMKTTSMMIRRKRL
ncbi:Hypothetical predicted protein, partial [Mytilus galloprovincialis]